MRSRTRHRRLLLLLLAQSALAADREWGIGFGRGTESADTDIVRLTYRRELPESARWWTPTHVQLGARRARACPTSAGRRGASTSTRRQSGAPNTSWGYIEGGIGLYLLSKTINNDENRVPSSLEFGSHLGVGLRLDNKLTLGVAYQHLSNAGLKQPNGGIDLILVQYTLTR